MPGFEILGKEELSSLIKLFKKDGAILFAHGFEKLRKRFHVREFENACRKKMFSKYALAVTSGTSAIKIGLKAIGIKPGDEVITQGFNFIATVEAIIDTGAKPIMCNVDTSLNMCPRDLKKLITKKTKAILPVHMLGTSCRMDEIMKIAKQKKIKVLEDNCESMGAKYKNKLLGTLGDAGVISYDFGKTITCGEGGMLLTNNKKIDKYAREYHDHGHELNPKYPRGMDTVKVVGFNYRMTEMQAIVGKEQLKKLDKIVSENEKRYKALEKNLKNLFQLRDQPKNSKQIYDTLIITVKNKRIRKKIVSILNKEKFGTKNLPDAIKWHCAYFWNHALPKKQILRIKDTKIKLENSIAIPIWLRKSKKDYDILGKKLSKCL
jgi:8-amino-3,8-dideoxy-alpha-D-manno-octulosonate transaminase